MRLQQRVLREPAVLVCFLTGSYGRRAQDRFSDLDVTLIFEGEGDRAQAYSSRREFVQSIMPYVPAKSFDAEHVRPFFHVALFANGAKADFRYETLETIKPSPWDRDIHLIKDLNEWGKRYAQAVSTISSLPPRLAITESELIRIDNRFWVMYMDVYRLLLRGDLDKPFPIYLELLNFTIPVLLDLLPFEEPFRQALLVSQYDHDSSATLEHMQHLLNAYLDARQVIVHRFNLSFRPNQEFENSIKKIIDKRTR
jgi:hypothetical protein